MTTVGIVGVGSMGRQAAEALATAGHAIVAHDVVAAKLADWAAAKSVRIVPSASAVAAQADTLLMYLPDPPAVVAAVTGDDGLLAGARPGSVIVDQSTVDPQTSQAMARLASQRGVGYLDAPVLGRPALVGRWSLPIGGDASDLAKCAPVLRVLAANLFHIGPSGAGNKVKLLNQLMFGAINAMTAEMMAIAERVGVPPKLLYETITASQAATVSNLFRELGARIAADDYRNPTFSVDLLIKDVHLAVAMARASGAPPLIARSVEFVNETARAQGFGNLDTAVMWKCYRAIWDGGAPAT